MAITRMAREGALGVGLALAATLVVPACTGGGGGGGSVVKVPQGAAPAGTLALTSGTIELPPDSTVADPTSAAERARLGVARIDRSYTFTSPAGVPVEFSFAGFVRESQGTVSIKVASTGGTGAAASDLEAAGLRIEAANVLDQGAWLETVGDGFARLTIAGAVTRDEVLVIERADAKGTRVVSTVAIRIGGVGPLNPIRSTPGTYAGIISNTPLLSSDGPVFGLPAIAGSGDRVSVTCYDSTTTSGSTTGCVPGFERRQRRLQVDVITGQKTMGETVAAGQDSAFWRDCEIDGLLNVLAIAQSGGNGARVSMSFDRGATFPASYDFSVGRTTRLVQIKMSTDYETAVVFWDFDPAQSDAERLVLVEGRPASYDSNGSPATFRFDSPQVLVTLDPSGMGTPLVSDLERTSCGDLFVAYGYTTYDMARGVHIARIFSRRRDAGATTFLPPVLVDEIEIVPMDPTVAVVGCGSSAQVFVAYEAGNVRIRHSSNGGQTFPDSASVGGTAANSPRLFARQQGGAVMVDCAFLDQGVDGQELRLFRSGADLRTGAAQSTLVATKQVPVAGGGYEIESIGWSGFDATELAGDIFVSYHVQRTAPYALLWASANGTAAASAPVLYDGMTQPVPAFDANARQKLYVLRID